MINPIRPVGPPIIPEVQSTSSQENGASVFSSALKSAVRDVEAARANSEASVEKLLRGESQDLHSVLLDVQRAELALEIFVEVRNKVTQAYQEIMRMPI